jgi:uncharacterized protein
MLRVNLMDLDREGTIRIVRKIESTDPLWDGAELPLAGPVSVDLSVTATATGQVLARGSVEAKMTFECRRCLAEVVRDLDEDLTLIWAPRDEFPGEEEDGGEVRVLELGVGELDMGPAVREELILLTPKFVVCRENCQGLCPKCGIDRNKESCNCTLEEPDPRWDALRALKED